MNEVMTLTKNNIFSLLRKKWFFSYLLGISLILGLFHFFGLSESHALGFTGLSRLLMIFIQVSILLLPLFTLFTTSRNLVRERENGVWEYLLSQPINLLSFYSAKVYAYIVILFVPMVLILLFSSFLASILKFEVNWFVTTVTALLIFSNIIFFVGLAFLISVLSKTQEMAMSLVFILWILFEIFIDAVLLGMLLQMRLVSEVLIGLALLNPLQGFRTASISLFDPDLTVLGPISYTMLDIIGVKGLISWSIFYPLIIGIFMLFVGYKIFNKSDLL